MKDWPFGLVSSMYTIVLSSLFAVATFFVLYGTEVSSVGWSICLAIVALVGALVLCGVLVRKRMKRVLDVLQADLADGQRRLQAKIAAYQARPTGDPHRFMDQVQKEQQGTLRRALAKTEELRPFQPWVPFFRKQIATMQMQFHYQLKEFEKVDALLPSCLFVDPLSSCMKIARLYSHKKPLAEMEKAFRKAKARTRYDQSAILYGLMSWIYVKEGKIDEAFKLLEQGCKDNSVEEGPSSTLKRNRDILANNRVTTFSNAGFGDLWYSLFLEEPKIRYERRAPTKFGRFG